ncbi:MAG: hypothetical protein ABJA57_09440 [Ginsengibacter sp.]
MSVRSLHIFLPVQPMHNTENKTRVSNVALINPISIRAYSRM